MIENGGDISKGFEGLSRREVVRKVGFASLVALPIVTSIVAPKAASAQTPTPPPCLDPGDFRGICSAPSESDCGAICTSGEIAASAGVCCSAYTGPTGERLNGASAAGCIPRGDVVLCSCLCD